MAEMTPAMRQQLTLLLLQCTLTELDNITRRIVGMSLDTIADTRKKETAVADLIQRVEAHNRLDSLCHETLNEAPRVRDIAYLRVALREAGVK